jgi:hypothetical protein
MEPFKSKRVTKLTKLLNYVLIKSRFYYTSPDKIGETLDNVSCSILQYETKNKTGLALK